LEDIDEAKREHAHRLLQCVAVASRPLRVEEVVAFLAFDFDAGSIPTFMADWCPADAAWAIASTCSSLISIVKLGGSDVVQFTHFSVKEFLISSRLAISISLYRVLMVPAHTMVAQACLGALLHMDENVTKDSLKNFPLAEYAGNHWLNHAKFNNVSSNVPVQDGMKVLFDPSKPHLTVWIRIFHPDRLFVGLSHTPSQPSRTPLHYAAQFGICEVVEFLVVEHSQNVNTREPRHNQTPLFIASQNGHTEVIRILLQCGADAEARDNNNWTPLHCALRQGRLDVVQLLLNRGADATARDNYNNTPLHLVSLRHGYL
jgi:Ankyrin repeats (3 copies)